jgi:hypothetical protein
MEIFGKKIKLGGRSKLQSPFQTTLPGSIILGAISRYDLMKEGVPST